MERRPAGGAPPLEPLLWIAGPGRGPDGAPITTQEEDTTRPSRTNGQCEPEAGRPEDIRIDSTSSLLPAPLRKGKEGGGNRQCHSQCKARPTRPRNQWLSDGLIRTFHGRYRGQSQEAEAERSQYANQAPKSPRSQALGRARRAPCRSGSGFVWGPSWLSTSPALPFPCCAACLNISKLEGLSTAQTQPPAPCLTGRQIFPNGRQFPADPTPTTLGQSGRQGLQRTTHRSLPLPGPSPNRRYLPAPRAQHGWSDFLAPSSLPPFPRHTRNKALALRKLLGVRRRARAGGWVKLEPHHAEYGPRTLRNTQIRDWVEVVPRDPSPSAPSRQLRAARPRAPQLTTAAQPSPGAVACAPCAPSPQHPASSLHYKERFARAAWRRDLSRSSFLSVPGPTRDSSAKTPRPFVSARQGGPPPSRLSRGKRRPAARGAPPPAGMEQPAPRPSGRHALVFRVDLPHQRDVSLQIKGETRWSPGSLQRIHQVDLLPVSGAQHGSPRSPATPARLSASSGPAPSEPGAAKCKAPARRAPRLQPAPRRYISSRAAWSRDRLLAGRALGGLGRGAGTSRRARLHPGAGAGAEAGLSAGRAPRRPPRRTCPSVENPNTSFKHLGNIRPPAPRMRPGATAPSPGPRPRRTHAPSQPRRPGAGLCLSLRPGRGSRGQRAAGGNQTY